MTTLAKSYLTDISGTSQKIEPEHGRTKIGGIDFSLLDKNNEITAMIGADTHQFQRKKVTVKAGYQGLDIDDFVTIITAWVTSLKLNKDLTAWDFKGTDAVKWTQRKVFRNATESAPVVIQGNPLNIFMAILTSTGNGTNGSYDWLDATDGLGIDSTLVNISNIEAVRDEYYRGASNYMKFTRTDSIKSKDFIEKQICKPLNLYWFINGSGQIDVVPFRIPFSSDDLNTFDQDDIIGDPEFDANFSSLINELEFSYNHDGDDYQNIVYYADATSISNRGPGKSVLEIKSEGFDTDYVGTDLIERRKKRVFSRYAAPPPKITFETFYNKWPIEIGEIVKFSHPRMPDISDGTIGLDNELMEVVGREPLWGKGRVKWTLLWTGFHLGTYSKIAPSGTVVSGVSNTQFTMSAADCAKFTSGWEIVIQDSKARQKGSNVTITDITGTTVTIDSLGQTPVAGDLVRFADYSDCTTVQQTNYMFVLNTSSKQIYG